MLSRWEDVGLGVWISLSDGVLRARSLAGRLTASGLTGLMIAVMA
jgi:hypothetical protein